MPQKPRAGAPAKPTREEKKAARAASRQSRRDTWNNVRQAFSITRRNDSRLIPYLVGSFLVVAIIVEAIAWFVLDQPYLYIIIAVVLGLLAAMLIFSRRAQAAMYKQADGQPGAALYVLQNLRGNDWHTTEAVAATAQLDAVHRLTGRPGIVLVGEGAPHRVKGLIAQEKRKVSRLVGDTPIYDVIVGEPDEGGVALGKLNAHLLKLPRNLSSEQVTTLNRRLAALSGSRMPLPQGPMPGNAKMRNVQRTVRRRTG